MCAPEDEVWLDEPRTIEVDVTDPEPTPVLLGPDGQPVPRLVHRFGFRAAPEWETP